MEIQLSEVRRLLAADLAAASLGIAAVDRGDQVVLEMVVGTRMGNAHGTCHGGITFTLADSAFSVACNLEGPASVAASCEIHYLESAQVGDRLQARAALRAVSGRSAIYDVSVVRVPEEVVVAEFRGRARTVSSVTAAPAGSRGSRQEQ